MKPRLSETRCIYLKRRKKMEKQKWILVFGTQRRTGMTEFGKKKTFLFEDHELATFIT